MESDVIDYLKAKDEKLSKVIDAVGELYFQQHSDSFSFLVREIVGQMVSAAVKKVIFGRLVDICNGCISVESILNLSIDDLRRIGLSNAKASYIKNLAKQVNDKSLSFDELETLSDKMVIKQLTAIKGIGNWTAKMYLIFYLRRDDILPYEDGAFLQAYKWLYNTRVIKPESIAKRCKKWKPYTSIGARYLYRALDLGLTKTPIKQFLEIKDTAFDKVR